MSRTQPPSNDSPQRPRPEGAPSPGISSSIRLKRQARPELERLEVWLLLSSTPGPTVVYPNAFSVMELGGQTAVPIPSGPGMKPFWAPPPGGIWGGFVGGGGGHAGVAKFHLMSNSGLVSIAPVPNRGLSTSGTVGISQASGGHMAIAADAVAGSQTSGNVDYSQASGEVMSIGPDAVAGSSTSATVGYTQASGGIASIGPFASTGSPPWGTTSFSDSKRILKALETAVPGGSIESVTVDPGSLTLSAGTSAPQGPMFVLPPTDASVTEVRGMLSQNHPDMTFRVSYTTGDTLGFDVHATGSVAPPVMWLLDAQYHVLAKSEIQDNGDARIAYGPDNPFQPPLMGPPVYLKISMSDDQESVAPATPASTTASTTAPSTGGAVTSVAQPSPSGTSDFVLDIVVTRPSGSLLASGTGPSTLFLGQASGGSSSLRLTETAPAAGSQGEESSPGEAESLASEPFVGTLPIATGPLPSRSSAPFGGVLASGDPVPLVNSRDAAVVDLALLDLGPRNDEQADQSDSIVPPNSAMTDDAEDLDLAFQGPGTFPLIGSSFEVLRRSASTRRLPTIETHDRPESQIALLSDTEGRALLKTDNGDEASSVRRGRRASTAAGLSIVAMFTAGLVLPRVADPTPREPRLRSALRRFFRKQARGLK